jgi:hypothetical protein
LPQLREWAPSYELEHQMPPEGHVPSQAAAVRTSGRLGAECARS